MNATHKRLVFSSLAASILLLTGVSVSTADLIDVLGIHQIADPAPETVINATDAAGTTNLAENTNRKVDNMLDSVGLSGPPFVQASISTTSQAYYNSNGVDRGDLGILVDLGRIHRIDAIQLYGYNISDGGGIFADRTPGTFTICTATSDSAITKAGGIMLVDDDSMFTQHGTNFGMSDPGASATTGETYLFGGAAQPPEVLDTDPDVITEDIVFARYIFIRNLEPIETDPEDLNIVGMGEIQFYGFSLGDVNLDGLVNLLDVAPFVDAISSGEYDIFADTNFDGSVNLLDVQPFVDLLAG